MAKNRQSLIRSAERQLSRGKLNSAISDYLKILEQHPDDTSTLNRVGDLYVRLNRLDEAIELFRRAAEHFSNQGFFVKAIAINKKILRLDPTQLEVAENLADLQQRQGLITEARRQFQVVAEGYLKRGDSDSAVAVHRKLVELEPRDPSHRLHLAGLLKQQGQVSDAVAQYRAIAEMMLSHGKAEEAVRLSLEAVELDPENLSFVSSVVSELQGYGHFSEADSFLERVSQLNPDARTALEKADKEVESRDLEEVEVLDTTRAPELEVEETVQEVIELPQISETSEGVELIETEVEEQEEIEFEIDLGALELEAEPEVEVQEEPTPVEDEALKELMIEADVLARYGLEDKAAEKLEEIIQLEPLHFEARRRLIGLKIDQRDSQRVVELASEIGELASEKGRTQDWEDVKQQLVAEGYRFEADEVLPPEEALAETEEIETPEPVIEAAEPMVVPSDLSWLDEVVAQEEVATEKSAGAFAEEEGFFDLASELERELDAEEGALAEDLILQPEEQSIEEIVEGFRKGMEETLSPEDYDTHYNLGIAYREMGLLDEAISEFQLASKDSRYLVDCCSLLASCFLEKGFPELAIKWYNQGLSSPIITEEETLGLVYELGDLYLAIGETEEARRRFVEIYGINSSYRDVGSKLESLDQR